MNGLTMQTKDYLKICKKNNPKRYAVAGLGEWGVTEGVILKTGELKI